MKAGALVVAGLMGAAQGLLMPPCPLSVGAPVGGMAGQFVDINGDGLQDIVYSFSKGDIPGGGGGEPGTYTAIATFLNTGNESFCSHYEFASSDDFLTTWYRVVGRCIDNMTALYPPCPDTLVRNKGLLTVPCAMNAYYTQTPTTVQHGQFLDINNDGLVDLVYAYGEGSGDSALATFLNIKGEGFCILSVQEVLEDQCMGNARQVFPYCGPEHHRSNRTSVDPKH
eukprot:Hpha_TRINITY_DN16444_c0_g3::TRINITY_DN16444_c0_g3_i1::g.161840::m.161840